MKDIIIYANKYIPNNLGIKPNLTEYYDYVINIQECGLSCIPKNKIVTENTFSKHISGSVHSRNKVFQFKCRLHDIDSNELSKIIDNFYKNDFFYVNYYNTEESRKNSLDYQISKYENNLIKLLLISKNDYYPKDL